jgi:hypothetical protein
MGFGIDGIGSGTPGIPKRPPARVVTNREGDRLELSESAERPRARPDGLLAVGRVRSQQEAAESLAKIRRDQAAARQKVAVPRPNPGAIVQRAAAAVPLAAEHRELTRQAREARQAPLEPPKLPGTTLDLVA